MMNDGKFVEKFKKELGYFDEKNIVVLLTKLFTSMKTAKISN